MNINLQGIKGSQVMSQKIHLTWILRRERRKNCLRTIKKILRNWLIKFKTRRIILPSKNTAKTTKKRETKRWFKLKLKSTP